MKEFVLFRHAKSSWDAGVADDFDRPLNQRGRRAAVVMANWLAGRDWRPDLVLCSAAARTQETLALSRTILSPSTIRIERSLYLASARVLRRFLERIDDTVERAMIIAHNPGLQELATELDHGDSPASIRRREKFPTAAMAWFRIDAARWRDGIDTHAILVDFMTPGAVSGVDQD